MQFVVAAAVGFLCGALTSLFILPVLLTALMPREGFRQLRFARIVAEGTSAVAWLCARIAHGLTWQPAIALVLIAAVTTWSCFAWQAIQDSPPPTENQGYFTIDLSTPGDISQRETERLVQRLEQMVSALVPNATFLAIPGYSAATDSSARGRLTLFVILSNEALQEYSFADLARWLEKRLPTEEKRSFRLQTPSLIAGQPSDNVLQVMLLSQDASRLTSLAERAVQDLADSDAIREVGMDIGQRSKQPQLQIDQQQLQRLGIAPQDVTATYRLLAKPEAGIGPTNANYFIHLRPETPGLEDSPSLSHHWIRTENNRLIRLGQVASLRDNYIYSAASRHNLLPAVAVTAEVRRGAKTAAAVLAMQDALQSLPLGSYTITWSADSCGSPRPWHSNWTVIALGAISGIAITLFAVALFVPDAWSFGLPGLTLLMWPLASAGSIMILTSDNLGFHLFHQAALVLVLATLIFATVTFYCAAMARRRAGDSIQEAASMTLQAQCRPLLVSGVLGMTSCAPLLFDQSWVLAGQRDFALTLIGGLFSTSVATVLLMPSAFVITQWGAERLTRNGNAEDIWHFERTRDIAYNLFELLTSRWRRTRESKEGVAGSIAIMTVTGAIKPAKMGTTLSQERLFFDPTRQRFSDGSKEANRIFTTVFDHVTNVRIYGGHTIVDGVTVYEGRNPVLLERVSRATGVRIVTNTGYSATDDGQLLPPFFLQESAVELAERWLSEWRNGIDDTGIRPGFIKIGADIATPSTIEEKLCLVAAHVHLESGLTIASRTPNASSAQRQLDLLANEGVNASAYIWLHAQTEPDVQAIVQIAKRGAWVQIDDFTDSTLADRMRLIRALHEEGLVNRLLVSQHTVGYVRGTTRHSARIQRLDRVFKLLIPALFRDEFLLSHIRQLTVSNPSRAYMTCVRRLTNPTSNKLAVEADGSRVSPSG